MTDWMPEFHECQRCYQLVPTITMGLCEDCRRVVTPLPHWHDRTLVRHTTSAGQFIRYEIREQILLESHPAGQTAPIRAKAASAPTARGPVRIGGVSPRRCRARRRETQPVRTAMSRYDDISEGDDDRESILSYGRFRGQLLSALRGKRTRALLQELLDALQAMPVHRLVSDAIALDGGVCLVGALAAYQDVQTRHVDWDEAIRTLEVSTEGDLADWRDTEALGHECGFPTALAWQLGYINDEWLRDMEPEERWTRAVELVTRALAGETSALAP